MYLQANADKIRAIYAMQQTRIPIQPKAQLHIDIRSYKTQQGNLQRNVSCKIFPDQNRRKLLIECSIDTCFKDIVMLINSKNKESISIMALHAYILYYTFQNS